MMAFRDAQNYYDIPDEELKERIAAAKDELNDEVVLLGHHYQRDDIIEFADFRGDSFKLANLAAERDDARWIVFCGVHFMAESADIISSPHQKVLLPDMEAGCPMADMAQISQTEKAWEHLEEEVPGEFVPITYMNSTAKIKAFCGELGGAVCTSSNAGAVFDWVFDKGKRVFFLPDRHLGLNTALAQGVDEDRIALWDPDKPRGGLKEGEIERARVIVWRGWCSVHQAFKPQHIDELKEERPHARVVVHPECPREVVDKSDAVGSTQQIIETVADSPAGSVWAVGTEAHLVNRLDEEMVDKEVFSLSPTASICPTMFRINLPRLAWIMENLADGEPLNEVSVSAEIAEPAKVALDTMLAIK